MTMSDQLAERPFTEQERHGACIAIADLSRVIWGDNTPEFLAGLLVSLCNDKQLTALIMRLRDDAGLG